MTLLATAISTYALEGIATAAGVLLAASHVLRGLDYWLVLVLLGGHLPALGSSTTGQPPGQLEAATETGTSTNVLSKAAYELAKLRHEGSAPRESLPQAAT